MREKKVQMWLFFLKNERVELETEFKRELIVLFIKIKNLN